MTLVLIGLFIIWLGGFATGSVLTLTAITTKQSDKRRTRVDDLYPKRGNDAP